LIHVAIFIWNGWHNMWNFLGFKSTYWSHMFWSCPDKGAAVQAKH
jgi:hypothetical protein